MDPSSEGLNKEGQELAQEIVELKWKQDCLVHSEVWDEQFKIRKDFSQNLSLRYENMWVKNSKASSTENKSNPIVGLCLTKDDKQKGLAVWKFSEFPTRNTA